MQGYVQFWMRYLSEIFQRHSQDISGLFTNNFEFLVCLSVCQFSYFLTEIRIIWGYLKFWMRYLSEIFQRLSWDVFAMIPNNSEFLVCLSVCQLAYFLTKIRLIQGYLQFCMRYLSEIFWRHFQGISGLFPNYYEFIVCLSVCQLAYFLTERRHMKYFSDIFRGICMIFVP